MLYSGLYLMKLPDVSSQQKYHCSADFSSFILKKDNIFAAAFCFIPFSLLYNIKRALASYFNILYAYP